MKILITGNKGFIGGYLEWLFKLNGHKVIGIDKKENQNIVTADLPEAQVVVHCAANLFNNFDENLKSTERLVKNYQNAKFIFLSSAAVYGNNPNAKETDVLFPFGEYGMTKIREEMLVTQLNDNVVFRLGNVYGQTSDHGFINYCLNNKEITLNYMDHIRDYIHVKDIWWAVNEVINSGWQGTYNLGTGVGTRNIDVVNKIGITFKLSSNPPEEIAVSILNINKAKQFGFNPRIYD